MRPPAVLAHAADTFGKGVVGGDDATAVAHRAEILGRIKAERPGGAGGPGGTALIGRAVGLCAVFDKGQLPRDGADRIQIGAAAVEVDRQHGGGFARITARAGGLKRFGEAFRRHGIGHRIDVHEYGRRSCAFDGGDGRDGGMGHCEHEAALADAEGAQGHLNGVGPVAHADGMFHRAERGERLFKLPDLFAVDVPAAVQHVGGGLEQGVAPAAERRAGVGLWDEGCVHGNPYK